jgi:hypothetical protein
LHTGYFANSLDYPRRSAIDAALFSLADHYPRTTLTIFAFLRGLFGGR